MKKARILGVLLAGFIAVTGAPHIVQPLTTSASAAASKLAAPTGISGSAKDTSVKITWNAVKGADAYKVFKYNSATGKYDTYQTVTGTACNVTGLTPGTNYVFKVAAAVKANGKYAVQTLSKDIKATTKLSAPANLKAVSKTETSVKLTWSEVKGAAAYRVYYMPATEKTPTVYANVSGTSCNVKKLSKGQIYAFAVSALVKKGNKYVEQMTSDVITANTNGGKTVTTQSSLFQMPAYGISGAAAVKKLGMIVVKKTTQDSHGAKITAYTGYVIVNNQNCTAVILENAKGQFFGGMIMYDQNITTFASAKKTMDSSLGKPYFNMEFIGMEVYMWVDKDFNISMLMGADANGYSMAMFYGLGYEYAPDEIKAAYGGSGDVPDLSNFDFSTLFV